MSRAPSAGRKSVVPGSAGETGTAAAPGRGLGHPGAAHGALVPDDVRPLLENGAAGAPGRGIVHDPAAVRALEADLDGAAVAGEGLQLAEGGVDLGDPGLDDRGDDPGRGGWRRFAGGGGGGGGARPG